MAQAAHSGAVKASTTSGGTYTAIDGLSQASRQILNDIIDTTDLKDGKERTKIYGLQDGRVTISGQSEAGDTLGWVIVRDAAQNQTDLFLQVLPDGTNGKRAQFLASDWQEEQDVAGAVTWSCSLERTGADTAVP